MSGSPFDQLELVLRGVPVEAAAWVRRHTPAIAKIQASVFQTVLGHIASGSTVEAETELYRSLTTEQRKAFREQKLAELKTAVDARLAATAALMDGIQTLSGIGAAALSALGSGLTGAITVAAAGLAAKLADDDEASEAAG